MNQSNLAAQHPEGEPTPSEVQPGKVEKSSIASPVPKLGAQNTRSPEQQAEVLRLRTIAPYAAVPRDHDLFTKLNHWRELGICARVVTMDRLGLTKSLEVYTQTYTKRRSGLLVTPAPVANVKVEKEGSSEDLFIAILKFLVNPLDSGHLRQLRSRTWGTLKAYKVEILIINYADVLSFSALYELMRIAEELGISVVLAGQPDFNAIFVPEANKNKKYIPIYNTFLKWHSYRNLTRDDIPTIVQEWEKKLGWSKPLELWSNSEIIKSLEVSSQGLLKTLYEDLRDIASWKIDHPKAQINSRNIDMVLGSVPCNQPISKLTER